jgi:O-methyltransferase
MPRPSIALDDNLKTYFFDNNPPEHPELRRLREKTAAMPRHFMQISPEQGSLLAFLVRLTSARRILEIGTFTGYSSLTMALAMAADGRMVCCDMNEEWTQHAREAWHRAGVGDRVELRLGPAMETLATLTPPEGGFDLAFIDADKDGYDGYYERSLQLVRRGGLIVFDNMMRFGQVADPDSNDATTVAVRRLNAKIAADERCDRVLLAVGDGMTLVRPR